MSRTPGAIGYKTREARANAREIIEDVAYKENLKLRAVKGTLHPVVEQMLWHYAYGKPKDRVEVQTSASTTGRDYHEMSESELAALAAQTALEAARLAEEAEATDAAVRDIPSFDHPVHGQKPGGTIQ